MNRALAVASLLVLATFGCGPREQKITLDGTAFTIRRPVQADKVPNPVEIVKAAGAIPEDGATKGHTAFDGSWYASGRFPSSPENESVGASTGIIVRSFPSRKELEEALANNQDAVGDDSNTVLIGKGKPFYVVITGMLGENGVIFDIDLNQVAALINAEVRP